MQHDPYESAEWREFIAQQDRRDRQVGVAVALAAVAIIVLLVAENWDIIQSFLPN